MEHFYAYQAGGTQNYLIPDVLGPLLLTLLVFLHLHSRAFPVLPCIVKILLYLHVFRLDSKYCNPNLPKMSLELLLQGPESLKIRSNYFTR